MKVKTGLFLGMMVVGTVHAGIDPWIILQGQPVQIKPQIDYQYLQQKRYQDNMEIYQLEILEEQRRQNELLEELKNERDN